MKVKKLAVFLLFLLCFSLYRGFAQETEVNFAYLNGLLKSFPLSGPEGETRIYYWQEDKTSPEAPLYNLETVSLISRAYLLAYQKQKDLKNLEMAKYALQSLIFLQKEDGNFYKQLALEGKKEGDAAPLEKGQAIISLGLGYKVFYPLDKDFSAQLKESAEKFLAPLIPEIKARYQQFIELGKKRYPAWLADDNSSYSAFLILGLVNLDFREDHLKLLKILANGVMSFQQGNSSDYPFYGFFSRPEESNIWLLQEALQGRALAETHPLLKDNLLLNSALKEASGLLFHLMTSYFPVFGFSPHPLFSPLTPESAQVLVENFITLYEITGDLNYARLAGLTGSYFFFNNPLEKPLYNPKTGKSEGNLSFNGKAETAPAQIKNLAATLIALLELKGTPGEAYLFYQQKDRQTFQVLEAEESTGVLSEYTVEDWYYPNGEAGKVVSLGKGNTFWARFKVTYPGNYFIYFNYLKQPPEGGSIAIKVRVDAGKIYQLYQGGAQENPTMVMEKLPEKVYLSPGFHTLGVKFSGLLLSKPAVLDSIILQPVLEMKSFSTPESAQLLLVKSFDQGEKLELPFPKGKGSLWVYLYDENGKLKGKEEFSLEDNPPAKLSLLLPLGGWGLLEWKGEKIW